MGLRGLLHTGRVAVACALEGAGPFRWSAGVGEGLQFSPSASLSLGSAAFLTVLAVVTRAFSLCSLLVLHEVSGSRGSFHWFFLVFMFSIAFEFCCLIFPSFCLLWVDFALF